MNLIVDTPLPTDRNYGELKSLGLQYIQDFAGGNWTDLNESDPGITILEQLCYALTELGYCTSFPTKDVLARADGKDHYGDQFYFPDEILTCSPVTLEDYRKLLLDSFSELRNVYIYAGNQNFSSSGNTEIDQSGKPGEYISYLFVEPGYDIEVNGEELVERVFLELNQNRNLGELFAKPVILAPFKIILEGCLQIENNVSVDSVMAKIQQVLSAYISPPYVQLGYKALRRDGYSSDQVFNGPRLKNGWTHENPSLAIKREKVSLDDVSNLIGSIPEIVQINSLSLVLGKAPNPSPTGSASSTYEVSIPTDCIAAFVLQPGSLQIEQNTPATQGLVDTLSGLHHMRQRHAEAKIGATVDLVPGYPKGKYRHIEDYYSVQNTFPTQFAIGYDSIQFSAPSYRIAQSRQLKGYLMVFDQILANQFSQLANLSKLFSFKTEGDYYAHGQKWFSGIPYRTEFQTYFSQPLYAVPDVQPLLLGSDSFNFSLTGNTDSPDWKEGWNSYKEDPFNEYITGLRDIMETSTVADNRQSRMLDHLLARHGESGPLLDDLIQSARWLGSRQKTAILVKRILLQNYQQLSYNRTRAYNYPGAQLLCPPGRYQLTQDECERLGLLGIKSEMLEVLSQLVGQRFQTSNKLKVAIFKLLSTRFELQDIARLFRKLLLSDEHAVEQLAGSRDGWLDVKLLEKFSSLNDLDFQNYSSFELMLNLILGLSETYNALAAMLIYTVENSEFRKWIKNYSPGKKTGNGEGHGYDCFHVGMSNLSVRRYENFDLLYDGDKCLVKIEPGVSAHAQITDYRLRIDQLLWMCTKRQGFILFETVLIQAIVSELDGKDIPHVSPLSAYLIFPDYVYCFTDPTFKRCLDKAISMYWPIEVINHPAFLDYETLDWIISAYIDIHNALRYKGKTVGVEAEPADTAIRNIIPDSTIAKLIGILHGSSQSPTQQRRPG